MFFFAEPTIVAKTNVTILQSPLSIHLMLLYERPTQRRTEFFAILQIELGVKRTIRI